MSFDAHSNFGYSTVTVAPSPAASGTSLQVQTGHGALYPTAPFNCTVWPADVQPLASNAEIVRVTAVVGDVLTIVRAQEGTAAINIAAGYQIANTTSVKVFTDIENAMVQFISAGTTKAGASEIEFGNANGVTFGVDGQTVTASINAGGIALSAGTSSQGTGTISFADSNGITFGLDNGTLTATHNALTSQSAQVASASNGSFTFQTLNFGDAGNIHMGTSAGGIIFASLVAVPAAGSISAGTTNATLGGVSFVNSNGITFGLSSNSITASFSAGTAGNSLNVSAGTQSSNLTQMVFANSNGITFGLSNGTITASASGGGGGNTFSLNFWEIYSPPLLIINYFATAASNRPVFTPFFMNGGTVQLNTVNAFVQRNGGNSLVMTCGIGFYSLAASSQLSLYTSGTMAVSFTASTQWSGVANQLVMTNMGGGSLTQGRWVAALYISGTDSTAMNVNVLGGSSFSAGRYLYGGSSSATMGASLVYPYAGMYSTTTGGFPNSVGSNEVVPIGVSSLRPNPYINVLASPLV